MIQVQTFDRLLEKISGLEIFCLQKREEATG